MSQLLTEFIKDAYRAGKSRTDIMSVLTEAGWSGKQVDEAFSGFSPTNFPVPVPLPRAYISPRYAALNLFFFLVLLLTVWAGDSIIFTFLDYYLPDGLGHQQGMYYSAVPISVALRHYLAMIVVCAPLTAITGRIIRNVATQGQRSVPIIRLRLIYLVFFFAAFVMMIDFVLFVYYFLSGELGIRFILKVAVCAATAAGLYFYYRSELGNEEKRG